ncbi:hypothetical protein HZA38_06055 [Candidatus Peregrinibacteria bacterium]|nr:hypothetical protein [Candidatus Peregrinibacteria bacterium]
MSGVFVNLKNLTENQKIVLIRPLCLVFLPSNNMSIVVPEARMEVNVLEELIRKLQDTLTEVVDGQVEGSRAAKSHFELITGALRKELEGLVSTSPLMKKIPVALSLDLDGANDEVGIGLWVSHILAREGGNPKVETLQFLVNSLGFDGVGISVNLYADNEDLIATFIAKGASPERLVILFDWLKNRNEKEDFSAFVMRTKKYESMKDYERASLMEMYSTRS